MPDISTIVGSAIANISTVNAVAKANISTIDGVSPPAVGGTAFFKGHARVILPTSADSSFDVTITWSDGGNHTPTCAWFEVTKATADGAAVDTLVYGVGATDGTNDRCAAIWSEHNVLTSNCDQYTSDVACIAAIDAGAVDFLATSVSFGSNTVTINISNAPSTAWLIKVSAWSGTDAVEVGTGNPSTTDAGTVNKTGLGQSANAVLVATSSSTEGTFDETVNIRYNLTVGFYSWDGATARQEMIYRGERDARATSNLDCAWSSSFVSVGSTDRWGVRTQGWALSNHANGFIITTTEISTINAAHNFFYLAMALPSGVEAYAGTFSSPTTADPTDKVIVAPNWRPQGILAVSTHHDALVDVAESVPPDTDGFSSGSAISASSEFSMNITAHDGQGTTNTQSRTDSTISTVITDTGTVALQANIKSFNATGFTWEQTINVNSKAGRVIYLAFQEN